MLPIQTIKSVWKKQTIIHLKQEWSSFEILAAEKKIAIILTLNPQNIITVTRLHLMNSIKN